MKGLLPAALGAILFAATGFYVITSGLAKMPELGGEPPKPQTELPPRLWNFNGDAVNQLIADLNSSRDKLAGDEKALVALRSQIESEKAELEKSRKEMVDMRQEIEARVLEIQENESKNLKSLAQTYSVTVSFRGTGLDVDVVPILYDGDPKWYGNLVSQDDGSFLKTSIPLHLEFAAKRKRAQEKHFAQVVRLVKFWARRMKQERDGFRFKSFMIEMILAKLCDDGLDFSDYPEALQHFFTYVARTDFRQQIVFSDYYPASSVGTFPDTVQIIDPVNATNNVARLYTTTNADAIVDAALDAGDAIDAALAAPNTQLTVADWRKGVGASFRA